MRQYPASFAASMFVLLAIFLSASIFFPADAARASSREVYGRLPLHFETNVGQTHEDVRFLARGPGYTLYLTGRDAVFVLTKSSRPEAHAPAQRLVLRMSV